VLGIPDSVMPHVRRFGFSGVVALGVVVVMIFGINPITVLTGQVAEPLPHTTLTALTAIEEGEAEPADLVGAVAREANGFWERAFRSGALFYPPVTLQMVPTARELGCGMAGVDIGTFYCPETATIYVDMAAYDQLVAAHPEQGHIAQGYRIGVAYGHHVQNALKALDDLAADRESLSADELAQREQQLSAQAACYGGVWTKWAGLEPLMDDVAMVRAIDASGGGAAVTQMPSRAAFAIPETFAAPSAEFRKFAFDLGYGIPAGGSCRLDKIVDPA